MPGIAVVHLIRRGNDPVLFERFIASYRRHDSGLPHRLVLVFKGFDKVCPPGVSHLLEDIPYTPLFVSDEGLDITAYVKCATAMEENVTHLLFLNSHAEILADDWLKSLHTPFADPGVGATGATGSWQSNFNGIFHWPYTFLLVVKRSVLKNNSAGVLSRIGTELSDPLKKSSLKLLLRNPFFFYRHFKRFPNPHLRTNGFMIRRDTFIAVADHPFDTKRWAYVFESGRTGLSMQLMRMGLRLVVVDRYGKAHEVDDWHATNTFWTGDQGNLLIGDNQTRSYQSASAEQRRNLASVAWGRRAAKGWLKASASRSSMKVFDDG